MGKAPWVRWSFRDWFSDFKLRKFTFEEKGIYHELLGFMWEYSDDQCSLPDDNIQIASGLGISLKKWEKIREKLQAWGDPIFLQENGKLISKRLRSESDRWKMISKAGKDASDKRWKNQGNTDNNLCGPNAEALRSQHPPNAIENIRDRDKEKDHLKTKDQLTPAGIVDPGPDFDLEFEIAWKEFQAGEHGKGSKKRAKQFWISMRKSGKIVSLSFILETIHEQKTWSTWIRGKIPHFSAWLNGERFNDEKPPEWQEFGKSGELRGKPFDIKAWAANEEAKEREAEVAKERISNNTE